MKRYFLTFILTIIAQIGLAQDVQLPWTVQSFRGNDRELYFATIFRLPKGQSIYWANPGNSGAPMRLSFEMDGRPIQITEMSWPNPKRHSLAKDLRTYTLEDQVILFHRVPGEVQDQIYDRNITIKANWLTCAEICLQGSGSLNAHFVHDQLTLEQTPIFQLDPDELTSTLELRPKKAQWPSQIDLMIGKDKNGKAFLFYTTNQQFLPRYQSENLFYPFPSASISFTQENLFFDRSNDLYGIYPIEGKIQFPLTLTFLLNYDSTPIIASKTLEQFTPDLEQKVEELKSMLKTVVAKIDSPMNMSKEKDDRPSPNFLYFLFMAFLGGLILNVMPCVLPVISLKLFGLIKINGSSHKEIFTHNLLYTFGILLTFAILAAVVLTLKMTGELIGWGFQMQSPSFLFLMIIALVVFALNLFGLFEFRTPGGALLGNIQVRDQLLGSFLSGVLAVILSTPCSAPFLGTALTFAFTTSYTKLFILLMMIGFGLSFPILITGIFPKTISFLPRPGNWMNHLKKFLGLSLVLTAIWLITIFDTLTSNPFYRGPLIQLLIVVGLIIAIFIVAKIKNRFRFGAYIITFIALALSVDLLRMEFVRYPNIKDLGDGWSNWSVELLNEQKGIQTAFVKLSADWCITCKVDHKLIIESEEFKTLVEKYQLKLINGDYTSPDPKLEQWMNENDIVGVPAYLIQLKNGERYKIDGQLTINKLESILKKESL